MNSILIGLAVGAAIAIVAIAALYIYGARFIDETIQKRRD